MAAVSSEMTVLGSEISCIIWVVLLDPVHDSTTGGIVVSDSLVLLPVVGVAASSMMGAAASVDAVVLFVVVVSCWSGDASSSFGTLLVETSSEVNAEGSVVLLESPTEEERLEVAAAASVTLSCRCRSCVPPIILCSDSFRSLSSFKTA